MHQFEALRLSERPLPGPVRLLPEADRSVIETIRFGILFIMAFWSGSSRQAFCRLRETLTHLDPEGRIEVVVVDTDGCPDLYEVPEFANKLHGNGEAGWILDGRLVRVAGTGSRPTAIETYTRQLLNVSLAPV